jgi:hypothetical protein
MIDESILFKYHAKELLDWCLLYDGESIIVFSSNKHDFTVKTSIYYI